VVIKLIFFIFLFF